MSLALRSPRRLVARVSLVAVAAFGAASLVAPAQAAPLWPGGPEVPGFSGSAEPTLPAPAPEPQVQRRAPANFSDPSISPSGGEVVGVAQPVAIRFNEAIGDRAAAERAIAVTTSPSVDGHFYWINDTQVRWLPNEFYPAHTSVTVEAGGARADFSTGDSLITTADDATHQITITRNGEVVKTMPTSMGKPGHETPNGTYIVGEKFRDMYMDSSTYGVPVDSEDGYRTYVEYATRISYSGIFVHAAPWSEWAQGSEDTSHGCLNVSTEDGQWFFENSQKGDPVVVVNTAGGTLSGADGLGDWNR
ncbi:L,D-transpeptidase [Rhodococcoides yunnanense]|uniref:L,D-transpeptidase n=1 Tax=Rhodococcoides yunnanense TaxID=278209 RepID=UPI0009336A27|nr:L,D-transpeptidase [Rhodococcus yunnanensis]